MYFKCDFSKISVEQLATLTAVESLFAEQNHKCQVVSLKPMAIELSSNLSTIQLKRLFVDRIPVVANGWTAKIEGMNLVLQNEKADKPIKRGRKAGNKSDGDIRSSTGKEMAQPDI